MSIAEKLKLIMESQAAAPKEAKPDGDIVSEAKDEKVEAKKGEEGHDKKDEDEDEGKEEMNESVSKDPNKKGKPEEVTKSKDDGQIKQKKPAITFGMKEELEQFRKLAEEAELPADTIEKLTNIFEAAVINNVQKNVEALEEQQNQRVAEIQEELELKHKKDLEGLVENMDGYLSYVAEEWMNDNEVALEKGVRAELSESLLKGLTNLLAEHNIDVPEDKVDVVEKLQADNARLIEMNENLLNKGKQLSESVEAMRKEKLLEEVSEGLTESQAEKFRDLAESLDYKDEESFGNKLRQIRESFFSKKDQTPLNESVVTDNPVQLDEETKHTSIHPEVNELLDFFNSKK